MGKKFKNFISALSGMLSGEDYVRYIQDRDQLCDRFDAYLTVEDDKRNLRNDIKNVFHDLDKTIKEYGKATAK